MSHLSTIVGRLHVGTPAEEVIEYVFSRMTKEWREDKSATAVKRRRDVAREALKIHRRNRAFYDSLYGGGSADLEEEITTKLYGSAEIRAMIEAAEGGE